jgi:phospholipid N-methyltransferase
MFTKDFYPTPHSVIRKMVSPYYDKLSDLTILEPSAGKGDILDALVGMRQVKKRNLYAIELNPDLKLVLQGKEYKVIADDFLK